MRIVSIFSIGLLSLSVWGLFFAVFLLDDEPNVETELYVEEEQIEEEQIEEEQEQTSKVAMGETQFDEEDSENSEVAVEVEEVTEIIEREDSESTPSTEMIPETLEERASSRFNDILYDFEKDHPVSVDDLLYLVNLN